MKMLATLLISACVAVAAGGAAAQDKKDAMAKPMTMTMQECKDHMAMMKKDGMKKDDAMMKKDTLCADMMKKDEMMKKDAMPKK